MEKWKREDAFTRFRPHVSCREQQPAAELEPVVDAWQNEAYEKQKQSSQHMNDSTLSDIQRKANEKKKKRKRERAQKSRASRGKGGQIRQIGGLNGSDDLHPVILRFLIVSGFGPSLGRVRAVILTSPLDRPVEDVIVLEAFSDKQVPEQLAKVGIVRLVVKS